MPQKSHLQHLLRKQLHCCSNYPYLVWLEKKDIQKAYSLICFASEYKKDKYSVSLSLILIIQTENLTIIYLIIPVDRCCGWPLRNSKRVVTGSPSFSHTILWTCEKLATDQPKVADVPIHVFWSEAVLVNPSVWAVKKTLF